MEREPHTPRKVKAGLEINNISVWFFLSGLKNYLELLKLVR
jgi:hypothetical protein